jgi:hypothetical protein
MAVDYTVIVVYLLGMLAMGRWGMRRAESKSEFLVAGRRLGPGMDVPFIPCSGSPCSSKMTSCAASNHGVKGVSSPGRGSRCR